MNDIDLIKMITKKEVQQPIISEFWTEQVSYVSERDETFLDDDLLDKIFTKLSKK